MNWDGHKSYWPHSAHSSFVDCSPHRWHLQRWGDGDTLLFLHGAGASTHSWRDLMGDLGQDHHVVAVDLPGQGFTELGARNRCGLSQMAEDISALLRSQDIMPAAIIGHSAGAAIALQLVSDRAETQIKVISINGALANFQGVAGWLFPMLAKVLALNPLTALAFSRLAAGRGSVANLIQSTGSRISEDGLQYYRALISDRGHVDAALQMMSQWSLDGLLARLEQIENPVLFLTGARDRAVPEATTLKLADQMQAAQAISYLDLGHLAHEEQPDLIAGAIRAFLAA